MRWAPTYTRYASPHFGIHWPFWAILPLGRVGVLIGAPTLKLRGEYLAIVTLGFGEIVRIFLDDLSRPVNITNRRRGSRASSTFQARAHRFLEVRFLSRPRLQGRIKYYYLLLLVLLAVIFVCLRLRELAHRPRREAIREDEVAARAMGIDTTRLKLLAFAMGADFGGVAGGMFSAIRDSSRPRASVLVESIMVVSMVVLGMGNVWGVILGALLLSFLPEFLRFTVEGTKAALRPHADRAGSDPDADFRLCAGARHGAAPGWARGPSAVRKRELAARDGTMAEKLR